MKILFISSHHGTGASETLWIESAVKLAVMGHTVAAAVNWRTRARDRIEPLARKGIAVTHLNLGTYAGYAAKLTRRLLPMDRWELGAARRVIRRFQPDTIVFSEGNDISALPFMEVAKAQGVPYQVVTHGLNPADWPSDNIADRLRNVFPAAAKTYWVASRNIEEFEYHIGTRLANASVVFNPVKVDREASFQWPDESNQLRMACVARLQTRAKGHDLLLQAFAQPQWRQRNLCLTFFGEGENRRGLERLAALLQITGQVHFSGHVDKVQDIWRDHHMLAQPSRNEGMPLSLVEALMCGRPALATDVAGHAELVADRVNGFIAEAPTARHIGAAMERMWHERGNWRTMGAAAHERIRAEIPADPAEDFARRILAPFSSIS